MRFAAKCVAAIVVAYAVPAFAQSPSLSCPHGPRASAAPPSAQVVAARRALHGACAADMTTFCANVPKGCGRPMACLKSHRSQLSSGCTNAWQNLRMLRGKG